MTSTYQRRFCIFLVPLSIFLVGASVRSAISADELIRQANRAFLGGDQDEAERLYATAEEHTTDPGLVAFNRAAVLFQREQYREAELDYARVLDDAACPPDRAAKAWYNRGTCLVRRGSSSAIYRSAIACFERCLDSDAAEKALRADARHNLELAKLLWNDARSKENIPDNPNENPPPEDPRSNYPPEAHGNNSETGDSQIGDGNATGSPAPKSGSQPNASTDSEPDSAQGTTPSSASANLQPLNDTSEVQPLSPEDTREYLRRTGERLKRDRQNLLKTLYGPERPGVRDW
jgi:hypothetical protein